ncbi:hypothetical protein M758_5G114900 [Ceratodon purpureus]|uniref:HMA domain-containing protein n=1 Tax=Ceratodon purpureus TaxID=3225 RepID=A0A8T0I2H2_CERPU|nr:hypothetical protein KC19_5G113900 [Ceratodon purpureus]KAG0616430.1 hypothetical protein M758_5G114900 [Ceratodon purpureus]
MSRFIRELFHGSSYRHHPRYYYDDAVVSYGAGRSMLPDVVLHVPMETMKDVERVKQALAIEGVHRVRCDMATQTVVVSGNVPPKSLLRRVRWIKRHSSILSFGAPYAGPVYGSEYPAYNPYALEQYPRTAPFGNGYGTGYDMEYGSAAYGTPYTSSYSGYMNY